MYRFVPRRSRTALLLAMTLTLAVWPTTGGLAKPPMISDEPAGDPGDGVLRPADAAYSASAPTNQTTASSRIGGPSTPAEASVTYILVPYFASPGQPWFLAIRLIRPDRAPSFGGRWHRAP